LFPFITINNNKIDFVGKTKGLVSGTLEELFLGEKADYSLIHIKERSFRLIISSENAKLYDHEVLASLPIEVLFDQKTFDKVFTLNKNKGEGN
jgi:hypothetical protein